MKTLMIDTSAYAMFKRGHPEAISQIRKAEVILLPVIVLGELWAGFEIGSRRTTNRNELDAFLASSRVRVAPIINETAERYARIYAYLRENGRPIPTNDLWIASSAMEQSAVLLTADAHFLQVPQIIVEHLSLDEI
ncbi:MAG: type II toxin-antitoxin system VapC family toxin [Candidatus Promineifilaceae bacterium]|nr:type II toxin-antitoxin system VapC family toxin [Candidatus Promineifilaceae bacterium]